MRPEDLDYTLPAEQIAQEPAPTRGDARMMVVRGPRIEHTRARLLPEHLPSDALVVVNDSRVVPARLHLARDDGRPFELLVCDPAPGLGPGAGLRAWVRGARRLAIGDRLRRGELVLRMVGADPIDPRARAFEIEAGELLPTLEAQGEIPLPPHWGGYRLTPTDIEFWQGRPDRLHDRFLYTRTESAWDCVRLSP